MIREDQLLLFLEFLDDLYAAGAEASLERFDARVREALHVEGFEDPYGPWFWYGHISIGYKRKELDESKKTRELTRFVDIRTVAAEIVAETVDFERFRSPTENDRIALIAAVETFLSLMADGTITPRDLDIRGRITEE